MLFNMYLDYVNEKITENKNQRYEKLPGEITKVGENFGSQN